MNSLKRITSLFILVFALVSIPETAYAQPYASKLVLGYEQFNNSANVAGDAITLEMKLQEPTIGVAGGLRYESVKFPGYSTYYGNYLYVGVEQRLLSSYGWAYMELGFNFDEFFYTWPMPDYYLTIGARFKYRFVTLAVSGRATRIIDGVGVPSGYYSSYGINFSLELE